MNHSKSCDIIRKKKSQKEEVKMQVFVRIRPFLKNEENEEIRPLKEKGENIIICKHKII
jgi:bisphosphoglycerate-dependent phosphoglycerate mutase